MTLSTYLTRYHSSQGKNIMSGSPFPMPANVPPPPMPNPGPVPGYPAGQAVATSAPTMLNAFPAFNVPQQPAPVDWKAKALEQIRRVVLVDGKPVNTQQMEAWAYTEIVKRMADVPAADVDRRITEGLQATAVGGVNLTDHTSIEPTLTAEQMQAKILELVPVRLKWQGAACAGDTSYIGQIITWMWGNLPAIASFSDPQQKLKALYDWLVSLSAPYELDDATRAKAVQAAPANPISDQVTAQLAAPITPPPAAPAAEKEEEASGPPVIDPVDGTACRTLRGLKTRVTKTHKTEWKAFCTQHGLDPETGRKAGSAPPAVVSPVAPVAPPPPSQPLPALVGQGAPVTQPVTMVPVQMISNNVNTLYDEHGNKTPAYVAAQQAAADQRIANMEIAHAETLPSMPMPPTSQPSSPVTFTPTFVPTPTAPITVQATISPVVGTPPPGTLPSATTPGLPPSNQMPPTTITPTFVPAQPVTLIQPQPQPGLTALNRLEAAKLLGGPVTLIVCRLLEINSVNLEGRMDANQLALLAEQNARAEMRIVDLAQAAYGAGKQAAQRHFADLLKQNPHCYMLMNGFEPILPDGYLEILIARTVHVYHVSDRGGNIEIKF